MNGASLCPLAFRRGATSNFASPRYNASIIWTWPRAKSLACPRRSSRSWSMTTLTAPSWVPTCSARLCRCSSPTCPSSAQAWSCRLRSTPARWYWPTSRAKSLVFRATRSSSWAKTARASIRCANTTAPTRAPASTSTRSSIAANECRSVTYWPTAPRLTTANWHWVRMWSWPSSPGRGATLRTPSWSVRQWCARIASPLSTSKSMRWKRATPSWGRKRLPTISPTSAKTR